jgi:hypothetical protein
VARTAVPAEAAVRKTLAPAAMIPVAMIPASRHGAGPPRVHGDLARGDAVGSARKALLLDVTGASERGVLVNEDGLALDCRGRSLFIILIS